MSTRSNAALSIVNSHYTASCSPETNKWRVLEHLPYIEGDRRMYALEHYTKVIELMKKEVTYGNVSMNVVKLSISSNKSARQLINTGVQYPKSLMVLWEYSLQSLYFQLQSVQARHYSKHNDTHTNAHSQGTLSKRTSEFTFIFRIII